MIFLHEILGKCLGAFKDRCILSWSEHSQTTLFKHIHDSANQRVIHSYNSKINVILLGKICQFVKFHGSDLHTLGILGNSRISRCAVNLVNLRALCHTPCDSMLSSATSYDQYFHLFTPLQKQCRSLLRFCHLQ